MQSPYWALAVIIMSILDMGKLQLGGLTHLPKASQDQYQDEPKQCGSRVCI